MKNILTFGFVALMTAATVTASAVPASAGGHGGHGGHGHGWHGGHGGHGWGHGRRWERRIYFGHGNPWFAHVRWCEDRYRSYDASTNMFLTSHGQWRHCRSPFR